MLRTPPESWKEMRQLSIHTIYPWEAAADEEMESVHQLQTWTLAKIPQGKKAIE